MARANECCQRRTGLKPSAADGGIASKIPSAAAMLRTAAVPIWRTASGMELTTPFDDTYAALLAAWSTRADSIASRAISGARSPTLLRGDAAREMTSATAPDSVLASRAFSARATHCSRVSRRGTMPSGPGAGAGDSDADADAEGDTGRAPSGAGRGASGRAGPWEDAG